MTVNEWRLAHQRCEFCKYCKASVPLDMWYGSVDPYCKAKEKYTKFYRGKHCKVFELKGCKE